jgi:hypothetical protein
LKKRRNMWRILHQRYVFFFPYTFQFPSVSCSIYHPKGRIWHFRTGEIISETGLLRCIQREGQGNVSLITHQFFISTIGWRSSLWEQPFLALRDMLVYIMLG